MCTSVLAGTLRNSDRGVGVRIYTEPALEFSFKKMCLKMSSAKRWPFCLGTNMFCRRHFQTHFLECKLININSNFTEICSQWSNYQNDMPAMFQIMAWRPTGDKPLSKPKLNASLHSFEYYANGVCICCQGNACRCPRKHHKVICLCNLPLEFWGLFHIHKHRNGKVLC